MLNKFQDLLSIKDLFRNRTYIHFTTLKPPRGEKREQQVEKFCEYLRKRDVKYWIVQCKSENDYVHYHGIVSYPNDELPDKMEANKVCYQRKVNRDIGFNYPLQQVKSIESIYRYIHGDTNECIGEYHSFSRKEL